MPNQEEHDRLENLVQPANLPVKPARSLQEEANSNDSLEGYAAMNNLNNDEFGEEAERLEKEKAQARTEGK